jgi:RNA polymerase sigma factor (sigma-70 family)
VSSKAQTNLESLNQRYRSALIAFFMRRSTTYSDAEDMTQEVFLRMLSMFSTDVENMDAYIFQVAANLLCDRGRKEKVRRSETLRNTLGDALAIDLLDPARILMARESLNRVGNILKDLPERTRHILILYRVEGMPQRDIAKAYGISVRAVQKHIAKAIDHMLLHMNDEGRD